MSPHDIEVLLHHHCSHTNWPLGETTAYVQSRDWMIKNGLLEESNMPLPPMENLCRLTTTVKGRALVQMLCETPIPEIREIKVIEYVDPRQGPWKRLER